MLHKKANSSSYSNLLHANQFLACSNNNNLFSGQNTNYLTKKSLGSQFNNRECPNIQKVITVIPEIKQYFDFGSDLMTLKHKFIFKTLCLKSEKRIKTPIFIDNLIEVKLLSNNVYK